MAQAWGTPPSFSRTPSRHAPVSEPYQSCSCESHRHKHEEINKLIRKCFRAIFGIILRRFQCGLNVRWVEPGAFCSKQYDFNCIITEETENIERQLLDKKEKGRALKNFHFRCHSETEPDQAGASELNTRVVKRIFIKSLLSYISRSGLKWKARRNR